MIFNFSMPIIAVCLIFCIKWNVHHDCASVILDVIHQIPLLITSSSSLVFAIWKWEKKEFNPPLHKSLLTNGAILHEFDWLFEVTFQLAYQQLACSWPAVPGMSVSIKFFICMRYRDCLESWTQLNSLGTAGRLSAVPGASDPINKNLPWGMSQVVPPALPPVPQVPLRLYGSQALTWLDYQSKCILLKFKHWRPVAL